MSGRPPPLCWRGWGPTAPRRWAASIISIAAMMGWRRSLAPAAPRSRARLYNEEGPVTWTGPWRFSRSRGSGEVGRALARQDARIAGGGGGALAPQKARNSGGEGG